jgi:phosphoribosylanthranilate isomerase
LAQSEQTSVPNSTATVRVKICGLSTPESVAAALSARAEMVGFVFFQKSPRNVSLADAVALAEPARGRADVVALVVDADDDELGRIATVLRPDVLQLHGHETPERVAAIRARFQIPILKAIAVETAADAARALAYRGIAEMILFDAKAPKDAVLPGGNGLAFDWHALADVKDSVTWALSGGLTPDNVSEAIRLTGATLVDVSSGVESAPGTKDETKIKRFIAAVRGQ